MASATLRCQAILSWNKEENEAAHSNFLEMLGQKFKSKGIDLTSFDDDWENHEQEMIKKIRNSMISIVFMTKEYASSTKYVRQLMTLRDTNTRVCPIIYLEPFDRQKELDCYGSTASVYCEYYTRLAYSAFHLPDLQSLDPSECSSQEEISFVFHYVFHNFMWWPHVKESFIQSHIAIDQTSFIRRFVSKTLKRMNLLNLNFGDKRLLPLQSPLLQIAADLMDDTDHLSYLGIVGPDASLNTWTSKWLYNRLRSSYSTADYLTLDSKEAERLPYYVKYLPLEDDLYSWALHVLYMFAYHIDHDNYPTSHELYFNLAFYRRGGSLLIIDGLETLDQFNALYKVLVFLGVQSKIILTTCNEGIFSSYPPKWTSDTTVNMDHCSQSFFWSKLTTSDIGLAAGPLIEDPKPVRFDMSKVSQIHSMYDDVLEYEIDECEGDQTDSMSEDANEEEFEGNTNAKYKQIDYMPEYVTEDEVVEEIGDNCKRDQIESTYGHVTEGESAEDVEEARKKIKLC